MANLQNLAFSVLVVGGGAFFYVSASTTCVIRVSPAGAHRARLTVLASAIDEYVMDAGHLPATLDDLPSPPQREPGCIAPDERSGDDYRRDPDGVHVDYTVIDASSLRYRIAIPGHTTKSGAWVPNTHIEESAEPIRAAP